MMNAEHMAAFKRSIADALDDPSLSCYAIVDSAQDATLVARFESESHGVESRCILAPARGNEMEAVSPHLIALSPLAADGDAWDGLLAYAAGHPAAFTLLASRLGFESLLSHLEAFSEIVLPDDTEMIFAYWDPAILGTLLGQVSDATLHVPGPVLTEWQRAAFLRDIACWWYWDRVGSGQRVAIAPPTQGAVLPAPPLKLFQVQIDMLVEASVPDQLIALLSQNSPLLLDRVPVSYRYGRIRKHLLEARQLGLSGMLDLLNYTSACLIYGEDMYREPIASVLSKVRNKEIGLEAAIVEIAQEEAELP